MELAVKELSKSKAIASSHLTRHCCNDLREICQYRFLFKKSSVEQETAHANEKTVIILSFICQDPSIFSKFLASIRIKSKTWDTLGYGFKHQE